MKKILSLVLAIIMIASMAAVIIIPASADEPVTSTTYASIYDGTVDTSWYDPANPQTEYTLTSAAQLAGLSKLVGGDWHQFRNTTIKLGVDIVWNVGVFSLDADKNALYDPDGAGEKEPELAVAGQNVFEYVPIGDRELCQGTGDTTVHTDKTKLMGQFYGSFDGQGHTISGLYYDHNDESYMGLFSIFCGKELKNLSIVNSYFRCAAFSGAFVGFGIIGESSGDNQTNVGTNFENLYSTAYIICDTKSGNTRSGGLVGMLRPIQANAYNDDTDPAVNGFLAQFNKCWFDGHIEGTKTTRFIGGILGFACGDDNTANREDSKDKNTGEYPENNKYNVFEFNNCLVTGTINGVPEPASGNKTEEVRVGLVLGAIFRGKAKFNDIIVNLRSTNINADTKVTVEDMGLTYDVGFMLPQYEADVKDDQGNVIGKETKDRTGKGIVGYYESLPVDVTYTNVFYVQIGYFTSNLPRQHVAEVQGTKDSQTNNGTDATVDNTLTQALGALGTNDKFDLSNVGGAVVPTLTNIKRTVDPIDPNAVIPNPADVANVTTTQPIIVVPPKTEAPDNTTASKPAETKAPVTEKAPEKSCGGFTAIGAVLALIALTGAAVVIKKK